jgi:hypothetical protein
VNICLGIRSSASNFPDNRGPATEFDRSIDVDKNWK